MQLIDNIPVWGTPDEGAVSQIKTCAKTADRVALMADHHKGYAVPIGGVVAYKDSISPSRVGLDIACGNKAVLLDMPGSAFRADIAKITDAVWQTISFGSRRRNAEQVDNPLFESPAWKCPESLPSASHCGSESGNHRAQLNVGDADVVLTQQAQWNQSFPNSFYRPGGVRPPKRPPF